VSLPFNTAHRLRMVELAVAGNPRFTVDPAEVESEASYNDDAWEGFR
jgi:nicotinic acid mononucleotide adenylyltransferase